MRKRQKLLIFAVSLLAVAFFGGAANAQVKWERKDVAITASPADKEAVAHFAFKNVGSTEFRIASVTTSCGCTTATWNKKAYVPQEEGEVLVTFKIGDRTGLQRKTILVESNDPQSPRTVFSMKVTIPVLADVKPLLLFWRAGEPLSAKGIAVRIAGGFPVTALTVVSTNPHVNAKVAAAQDKREFRISVTPDGTTHPVNAVLKITTDYPPGSPKTFFANVRVE